MHFSNPDILYDGFPTGVADQQDIARTGDVTAYIVHGFRPPANPATLVSISVSPVSASIDAGATQNFTASGHYDDSSTDDLTFSVSWSSSNTGVAKMTGRTASGVGEGTSNITASLDGVTSTPVTITVTDPPPAALESITVSPSSVNIETAGTQAFTATGHYSDQSTQNLTRLGHRQRLHLRRHGLVRERQRTHADGGQRFFRQREPAQRDDRCAERRQGRQDLGRARRQPGRGHWSAIERADNSLATS
jgi:hypothetical protein